jgi:hypothetical protein
MPIVRTYGCPDCGNFLEVTLTMDQADAEPPPCPVCAKQTAQEFKPFAIGGSTRSKAEKLVEDIIDKDYNVSNIHRDHRDGSVPKHSLKDARTQPANASTWGAATAALEGAVAAGRANRLKYGNGLDILQNNLKTGAEPDLIEISKRRAMRVW